MEAWAVQIIAENATIKAMQKKSLQKQDSINYIANNDKPQMNVDQITQTHTQKIKHSRYEENVPTTAPIQTPKPSFNNLQQQFEQSSKSYAYYNSEADEKVSIKVGKLLEGVFQKSAQDFDPLGFKLDPLDKNALFDKIKLKKVEKHWKLPDVKESAKGEKSVQFYRAVESSAAVQEGLYKSIRHIASGNTGNLFGELQDIFEASAVATGNAQSVREGQLDGIQQQTSQEKILSETSKKRFANINKVQKEVFQGLRSRNRNFGLGRGKQSRRKQFSNNKWNSKPSKYPNLRNQEYDYQKGRNTIKYKHHLEQDCQNSQKNGIKLAVETLLELDVKLIGAFQVVYNTWKVISSFPNRDAHGSKNKPCRTQQKRHFEKKSQKKSTRVIQAGSTQYSANIEKKEEMEENNRQLNFELMPLQRSLSNGKCIRTARNDQARRLDNQNRFRERVPSRVGQRKPKIFPRVHFPRLILPIQSHVLWHSSCASNLLQNSKTYNAANKRQSSNQKRRLL
ncbi:MAG: hypothetical protein EZS28_019056 [Streblomastix strix]|uniref:Uncharacterized protein n=1 Tax=Streblomastix strix TaxID=222440 RepID=A0A5J4VS71_9EUKA|nr:MAG: hypothetical protein EZS28_019056 [Streblomastix strix]